MRVSQLHPISRKHGAATVELALVLPVLALFFAIAVDFSRAYQHLEEISDSARRGALYLADVYVQQASPYETLEEAALAETQVIRESATVESRTTTDTRGNPCIEVTVTSPFNTIIPVPGMQQSFPLSRSVQMRMRIVEEP